MDEREVRLIDLPGVVTPSLFTEGWRKAGDLLMSGDKEAINPYDRLTDFDRAAGFEAGKAHTIFVFSGPLYFGNRQIGC